MRRRGSSHNDSNSRIWSHTRSPRKDGFWRWPAINGRRLQLRTWLWAIRRATDTGDKQRARTTPPPHHREKDTCHTHCKKIYDQQQTTDPTHTQKKKKQNQKKKTKKEKKRIIKKYDFSTKQEGG